jgi:transposase-like protein
MKIFRGQNLLEFAAYFDNDEKCMEYLSETKWEKGYICRKCKHTQFQIRKDCSRICNICSNIESATSNTLFHKLKFGLRKAFFICFEMATTSKGLSALQISVRFGIGERTSRMFMQKIREAMKSSGNFPMTGIVHVDEFVVGGYEEGKQGRSYDSKKKKVICAVELTPEGKVKRFYAFKIDDYSAKSLKRMFVKHIDKHATVTTDKWKGYNPIAKEYNITQVLSNKGANFKALHTMIHQIKSWVRTTYSWVDEKNIDRYFDEFCYRINRSQSKDTIFNNLIERMVKADNISHKEIVGS